jgi:FKBP-type peptidyl-prolyl cis-trans isomerase SlyD
MQAGPNKVVTIDYTVTDGQGGEIDSSRDGDPLVYIHGVGHLIPGLEKEVEGKSAGDTLTVVVPPEEAYGQRDEALRQVVARDQFEDPDKLQVGMQFEAQGEENDSEVVTVVAIEGEEITLDANHPLAGITLHFEVSIVEVRDASQEELDHGHVHGEGGHHH